MFCHFQVLDRSIFLSSKKNPVYCERNGMGYSTVFKENILIPQEDTIIKVRASRMNKFRNDKM